MRYINEDRILKLLYLRPMLKFGVRQLSRETKLDTKTVMSYLKKFVKEKIVVKKTEKHHHSYYEANRLSKLYRYKKSSYMLEKILRSGLIEYLELKCNPEVIILFGSMQKGTYHDGSDIDIFIKSPHQKLILSKYETSLGHRINIIFEEDYKNLSKGLFHNILNGFVLSGEIEI